MERPGIGVPFFADLQYLRLMRPVLEEEADFFEVNPEMLWRPGEGGRPVPNGYHGLLREVQERSGKPVVAHGLTFSVGTADPGPGGAARDALWLERVAADHEVFRFAWLSEHLGWTRAAGLEAMLPLPLPPTVEAARTVVERVRRLAAVVPDVALENPADYFALGDPALGTDLLERICRDAPCHLLLDLHNLHTAARNLGFDAAQALERLDLGRVLEIHVSGGSESEAGWLPSRRVFRLDSHDALVPEAVWTLLERALPRCTGLRGVVVERLDGSFDAEEVPALVADVRRARELLERGRPARPARPAPAPELEPGEGLAALQRHLAGSLTGHPAGGEGGAPELSEDARDRLASADPDGMELTRLIVRKLRFERLCRGDGDLEALFDRDPEGFVALFQAYDAEVPPREVFPVAEAGAFHRWRAARDSGNPAALRPSM